MNSESAIARTVVAHHISFISMLEEGAHTYYVYASLYEMLDT